MAIIVRTTQMVTGEVVSPYRVRLTEKRSLPEYPLPGDSLCYEASYYPVLPPTVPGALIREAGSSRKGSWPMASLSIGPFTARAGCRSAAFISSANGSGRGSAITWIRQKRDSRLDSWRATGVVFPMHCAATFSAPD